MARLAGHRGSLALADQAIVSGTNFLTGLVVARICGKAQLGLYLLAWSTVFIINQVFSALITTPYMINNPALPEPDQIRYRGSTMAQQLALSVVAAVSLSLVSVASRVRGRAGVSSVIAVLAAVITLLLFREFVRRMWCIALDMRAAVRGDIAASLLQLVLLAALACLHRLTALTAYAAVAAGALVPCALWTISCGSAVAISLSDTLADFRSNFRLARWIAASGALWALAMYTYPWMLVWLKGPSETGVWAACFGLVALTNPILLGYGNYLGPKIAALYGNQDVAELRRYVWRSCVGFILLLLPAAAVVWFGGDWLISHVYGAAFVGHERALRALILNVLLMAAAFPLSRGMFVLRRADLDMCANVAAIVSLFGIGLPLVRYDGVLGAAVGLMVTGLLTVMIRAGSFAWITGGSRDLLRPIHARTSAGMKQRLSRPAVQAESSE